MKFRPPSQSSGDIYYINWSYLECYCTFHFSSRLHFTACTSATLGATLRAVQESLKLLHHKLRVVAAAAYDDQPCPRRHVQYAPLLRLVGHKGAQGDIDCAGQGANSALHSRSHVQQHMWSACGQQGGISGRRDALLWRQYSETAGLGGVRGASLAEIFVVDKALGHDGVIPTHVTQWVAAACGMDAYTHE